MWLVACSSFDKAQLNVIASSERLKNNGPIKKRTLCVGHLLLLMKNFASWLYSLGSSALERAKLSAGKDAFGGLTDVVSNSSELTKHKVASLGANM